MRVLKRIILEQAFSPAEKWHPAVCMLPLDPAASDVEIALAQFNPDRLCGPGFTHTTPISAIPIEGSRMVLCLGLVVVRCTIL